MGAGKPETLDVGIVGAGPAGLAAACLMARAGASVALFGPRAANRDDERTSALLMGAVRMLAAIGVWPEIAREAAPLSRLRIVDRVSRGDHPSIVVFDSREIGAGPFGHNIPNPALTAALEARFAGFPGARRLPSPVAAIDHEDGHVRLMSADGAAAAVRLVVAADGRRSAARQAAGIAAEAWDYGQTALAARIAHEDDHHDTSTEIHRPGGPLTTVPLPGRHSAIVWLDRPEKIDAIGRCDDEAFRRALGGELDGLLGRVSAASKRGLFPVTGLAVGRLAARRTALVGEAAHVVPPIGAQGLNLGFRDAAWIAEIAGDALDARGDPGGEAVLARYARARRGDIVSRRAASDLLNRSLILDSRAVRGLRGLGLATLAAIGPARRGVMRLGVMGERDLPAVMRAR